MAETEKKILLEREYIVPLRKEWLKVPKYKRANKAVKALKEFIARHMKIYDRDLKKIKIDIYLNNELRFRGMRKPPQKIKVKAIKYENGTVEVKLPVLPKHVEFELARKAKQEAERIEKEKVIKEKAEEKKEEEKGEKAEERKAEREEEKEKKEEKIEEKEKVIASKEAELQLEKQQAKQTKHMAGKEAGTRKEPIIFRKSLKK